MLVLARRPGESIVIYDKGDMVNDPIAALKILEVNRHGVVSVGIEAPPAIAIDRDEVYFSKRGYEIAEPTN